MVQRTLVATVVVADPLVLVGCRSAPGAACGGMASPNAWMQRVGADIVLATLGAAALWLVAAWTALGLLAALGARLPGVAGRLSASLGRVVVPRAVRTMLAGSAGLGVLLAPLAAGASTPAAGPARAHAASAAPLPAPSWPTSAEASGFPRSDTRPTPIDTPIWPSDAPVRHPARTAPPVRSAAHPADRPDAATASASRDTTTVRRGDSLWLIAARRLGPQASAGDVARAWPRWYAANRDAVGPDPAVIHPGLVLHAPTGSAEERPS